MQNIRKNKKRQIVYAFVAFMFLVLVLVILGLGPKDIFDFYISLTKYRIIGYIVLAFFFVFIDKKSPETTLTWLVLFMMEPIIGAIIYMLFGKNMYKKHLARKMSKLNSIMYKEVNQNLKNIGLDGKQLELARLVKDSNFGHISSDNDVKILNDGAEMFSDLFEHLNKAKKYIHLEYFIIKDDYIGNKLKDILISKSLEGLEVKVLYDAVGCWRLSSKYVNELKKSGVSVEVFSQVAFPGLSRELNYRNHRKIVIIDGEYGYLGGMNIGDEYMSLNSKIGFWRDTHIRIYGSSVKNLQRIFLKDWSFTEDCIIENQRYYKDINSKYNKKVQIVESGPDTTWESIKHVYFKMITLATKRIWITTPYFIADEAIKQALISAAFSGIDVRIIIPSKADHYLVHWATRDNLEEFLKVGIKIYYYTKGFVHSKTVICDDNIASIGTANMDIRSFDINYEVNAIIYDEQVVKDLEEDFVNDLEYSDRIFYNEYINRGVFEKICDSIGRIFSPLQ